MYGFQCTELLAGFWFPVWPVQHIGVLFVLWICDLDPWALALTDLFGLIWGKARYFCLAQICAEKPEMWKSNCVFAQGCRVSVPSYSPQFWPCSLQGSFVLQGCSPTGPLLIYGLVLPHPSPLWSKQSDKDMSEMATKKENKRTDICPVAAEYRRKVQCFKWGWMGILICLPPNWKPCTFLRYIATAC